MKPNQETVLIENLEMYNPLIRSREKYDLEIEKRHHKSFEPSDFKIGLGESTSPKAEIAIPARKEHIRKEGAVVKYDLLKWRNIYVESEWVPLSLPILYSLGKKYMKNPEDRQIIQDTFGSHSFYFLAAGTFVDRGNITHLYPYGISYTQEVRVPIGGCFSGENMLPGRSFTEIKDFPNPFIDGAKFLSSLFLEDDVIGRPLETLCNAEVKIALPTKGMHYPIYPNMNCCTSRINTNDVHT